MTGKISIDILIKFNKGARLAFAFLSRFDPRVVRLSDPKRYSPRLIASLSLGAALVIGAVSLAAARRGSSRESAIQQDLIPEHPTRQMIAEAASVEPDLVNTVGTTGVDAKRHPRFYDPLYVFADEPVEGVSVYPLLNPPGIVVDLKGIAEPEGKASEFVGEDDRIRAVKRRATKQGLRYVIGIITPVKRVEIVHEGNVVMIFPVS
jgi:hypothetical protein